MNHGVIWLCCALFRAVVFPRIFGELSLTVLEEWNLNFLPVPHLEATSFACSHLLLFSENGIFKDVFHKTSR